jgi:hypothetical protein
MPKLRKPAVAPAWAAACALLAAATATGAQAANLFGSAGIITDRACTNATTTCTVLDQNGNATLTGGRLVPNQVYGGYQSSFSATALLPDPGGATASGTVAVSFGDEYLPTVKVGSTAGLETRTGASATAFQAFTYNGGTAIDLALNGALHFITSGDVAGTRPTDDFAGDGTLNVALSLLRVADVAAAFGPNSTANDIISNSAIDFADCGSGAIASTGFNSAGYAAGEYTANIGLSQTCDGHAITLNPGDSFVVVATLQALSNRGGFLDATHTFTVQYDLDHTVYTGTDTPVGQTFLQQSVSNSVALPEPGSWALLILGFGAVGATLRRRRVTAGATA